MVNRRPSSYRIRRTARRMRRYGVRPTMPITDGRELGPPMAELAVRWMWRYRSELAPLAIAAATTVAALILHSGHPHAWPFIAALTAAAVMALILLGGRIGLTTRIERGYAALVAATAGGWLAAATALGPGHRPLPSSC